MNEKHLEEIEVERSPPVVKDQEADNCKLETGFEFFMRYKEHLSYEYNRKMFKMMKGIHTYCFCGILED